jgi:VanZ family protein
MIPQIGAAWGRAVRVSQSSWFRWSVVIAWGAVIWTFGSSQALPMDAGDTSRWLLRKALHFAVYGILGALLVGALGHGGRWRWLIVVGVLVGLADEVHQATVPRRVFRVQDIGLDAVSTVIGGVIALLPGRRGDG